MTTAVLELFGNLADELRARNVPEGAVLAYLFGGCAVHLYTQKRSSSDVDAELAYPPILREDVLLSLRGLPPVDFEDPVFGPSRLVYDLSFNTTLGPLHEGYQDRALPFVQQPRSTVVVMLPSPEDLALSKLGRLADVDVADIVALMSLPTADWHLLEQLTAEAEKYYVGGKLTGKLAYARAKFHQRGFS